MSLEESKLGIDKVNVKVDVRSAAILGQNDGHCIAHRVITCPVAANGDRTPNDVIRLRPAVRELKNVRRAFKA